MMCLTITLFLKDSPMLSDTTVRKNAWDFKQSIEKILGENHTYPTATAGSACQRRALR